MEISNAFKVIKTRQQLQGELVEATKPNGAKMPYTTIFQAIRNIVKHEGIFGLQKGLPSALAFQFVMNSIRLGELIKRLIYREKNFFASVSFSGV